MVVYEQSSHLLNMCHNLVAYFSMEIGIRNDIPTYSGGLGILAGDTLKSIADMGVDAVGVTLLSSKGYFDQTFTDDGYQLESDSQWDPASVMKKLDIEFTISIEGRDVKATAWEYTLTGTTGKSIKLFYLDTDIEGNSPDDRNLTSRLYGGDQTYRLKQEMVLGIAGVKLLRKLNYYPKKYHMNEGHAAFLITELYNELTEVTLEEEKKRVLQTLCSFTTHTPVAAGHDAFDMEVVKRHFQGNLPTALESAAGENNKFSMTRLALNYSSYVNAVARKHQEVSKQMFPDYNIDYITNGIHIGTWVSEHHATLFDQYIVDWRRNPLELRNVLKIPLENIKDAHARSKHDLLRYIKEKTDNDFDPSVFTIGFARRATAYKRAELLFRDIERLKAISRDIGKIQLVFAGKAHPRDSNGKEIIKHIKSLAGQLSPDIKIVFLENYNMQLGKLLTNGVDLWLNTPKRPLEASGTSGMKAAANGVPSLSIPDGWWIEGCIDGVTGWNIGDELIMNMSDWDVDNADADSLYTRLADDILPLYYSDNTHFTEIMRNAIAINGSYFNTHRMVKQYLVRAYARNN